MKSEVIGSTMRFIYLMAAAKKDATPEQIEELKTLVAEVRALSMIPLNEFESAVYEIMDDGWQPAPEYVKAIEAMK